MSAKQPSLEPAVIVIFGITGDLSQRYLLPALYHLFKDNLLHEQTAIIGISRSDTTTEELFEKVELCVNEADNACDPEVIRTMQARTDMYKMDLADSAAYAKLLQHLNELEDQQGLCLNRLFYLSVPPQVHQTIVRLMGENGHNQSCQHGNAASRLLVEKPFGFDMQSAEALIQETSAVFKEDQIFRIDHYMAKETVQNILTFRFQNPIFESLWDNNHISGIEISAKETIGIEGRANFYEPLGALRDFIQSHLLQILGIILMDKPSELSSPAIHLAKQAALEKVEPVPQELVRERTVRGQYASYRQEVNNPETMTETYAEVTVFSGNPRWHDVPIKLLTGKALDERMTEVCITFKNSVETKNQLRFRIQPNEGIELDLITKKPGYSYETQTTAMDFTYRNDFGDSTHPNAYERVLVDAIRGDHTLFATSQEVLASWRVLQPVIDEWSKSANELIIYEPGTKPPLGHAG
jgi:glucose-6-phosphate 1-dehydrogenase